MADASPLVVYGSEISYFTGKLEGYLRYKEIPYRRVPTTPRLWNRVLPRRTGARQMPAVELPDGRWMTDTTPMIEWLETRHPGSPVIPSDPLAAFACRLVEDHADEWLWRPALHYRWSHRRDAWLLSDRIREELLPLPLPAGLLRAALRRRQRTRYVRGDGVTEETRGHVEGVYRRALDQLEPVLASRPFLLGERPCLADFGFFASMFRHFSLDPTPAALMLERAPAVHAWVARMWAARASRTRGAWLAGVPEDWGPILDEIGSGYLPYLSANARALADGRPRFDVELQGTRYRDLPTSPYRVWCLERLRAHHAALPAPVADQARRLLERHGAWTPLFEVPDIRSGHDPHGTAPFGAGLEVFARTPRAA